MNIQLSPQIPRTFSLRVDYWSTGNCRRRGRGTTLKLAIHGAMLLPAIRPSVYSRVTVAGNTQLCNYLSYTRQQSCFVYGPLKCCHATTLGVCPYLMNLSSFLDVQYTSCLYPVKRQTSFIETYHTMARKGCRQLLYLIS